MSLALNRSSSAASRNIHSAWDAAPGEKLLDTSSTSTSNVASLRQVNPRPATAPFQSFCSAAGSRSRRSESEEPRSPWSAPRRMARSRRSSRVFTVCNNTITQWARFARCPCCNNVYYNVDAFVFPVQQIGLARCWACQQKFAVHLQAHSGPNHMYCEWIDRERKRMKRRNRPRAPVS